MPHCFEIPEIMFHIFEHAYVTHKGRSDLVHLALTCKLFSGPALDVLWRIQTSLLPLVMTFPRELLNFAPSEQMAVATFTIEKTPMVSHWRRPLQYAKRIRTIMPEHTFKGFGGLAVHKSVLQTLIQSCPSKPMFPNLQELCHPTLCNIAIVDEATYTKSMFLLSPQSTLETLSFQYPSGRNAKDTRAFLTQFRNHFGSLESLRIFMDVIPVDITDFLSVFASIQNLKCFVLALGPGLSFTPKRKGLSLPNSSDAFLGLRSLGLHSFSTPFILQLLKAIHTSQLQIVNIHLASRVSPDELSELLGSVTSLSGPQRSVRSMSLTATGYTSAIQSIGDLLSLQHLRYLTLQNTGLVLDDRKLDEMARAWPILQHLSITNDVPPSTTVHGTLKSLTSFSQHCPYIESLELRLNAREVSALANPVPTVRRAQGTKPFLLRIDIRSDIRDSAGVASFLLATFPGITVKLGGDSQMRDLQETSPWNRVAEIVDEALGRPPPEPASPMGPRIMCMSYRDILPLSRLKLVFKSWRE
ncbi:hypothetical protein L210DRAFT_3646480 [Boletus edulis BED1]|uniref:F-box domain-containing protein n=1 Tax=Boletus edulis BED1 TaxID=1328754 RepID=A0AAD4BTH9_BOLED|nr:hypothetical protein L210DRAFT_3646480 [Boletus edulis BED1]